MNMDPVDRWKTSEEQSQICAHCGAENPPGLLLCLACGRDPISGRDLFAVPDIPVPGELPLSGRTLPSYDLAITLPEPIQVPDPLPIPSLEDFTAPPAQPHPPPPLVYRVPPSQPKDMSSLLPPLSRWIVGLLGLAALTFLGLGTVGSVVTLNLPNSICLGSLWLAIAIVWLGIMLARRGESRSKATGAHRRIVRTLGQRLFEITPGAAKEQRAQLPARQIPTLIQPASQLIYLGSTGDRANQLTQVLLGTLCAMVAEGHIELAIQTYDVLTASPLRRSLETIKRTAISQRTLYVGVGYLERLMLERLRRAPSAGVRDLVSDVLHQVGVDLLDRIAVEGSEATPSREEATDLDAQVAALREYCDELKAINPDLYQLVTQELQEAVKGFARVAGRRSR